MKIDFLRMARFLKRLILVVLFTIVAFEVCFRIVRRAGWLGKDYGDVFSQEVMNEGGFLLPSQDLQLVNGYGEKIPWITNSKGFRNNQEFPYKKPDKVIRVLSIGDSFASGYRVGQNETYSHLLEQQFNLLQDSVQYEFIIANVSNPALGLSFLNNYGLKYEPDIVLLGVTLGNDLSECFMHIHSYGEYQLAGTDLINNPEYSPLKISQLKEEILPSYSYTSAWELNDYLDKFIFPKFIKRIYEKDYQGESIFGIRGKVPPYIHDFTAGLGLFLKQSSPTVKQMYQSTERVLEAYGELAKQKKFDLKIVLFPQRYQVNKLDAIQTIKDYHLKAEAFDWQTPNRIINGYCEAYELDCIDLLNSFSRQEKILYLPGGDMHWNAQGHQLAASVIFDQFSKGSTNY